MASKLLEEVVAGQVLRLEDGDGSKVRDYSRSGAGAAIEALKKCSLTLD